VHLRHSDYTVGIAAVLRELGLAVAERARHGQPSWQTPIGTYVETGRCDDTLIHVDLTTALTDPLCFFYVARFMVPCNLSHAVFCKPESSTVPNISEEEFAVVHQTKQCTRPGFVDYRMQVLRLEHRFSAGATFGNS
jgi:hypothetical protein